MWNSRKSFRIQFETQAMVRRQSERKAGRKSRKTATARLIDLSEGGAGLQTTEKIHEGEKLVLFIDRRLFYSGGDRRKPQYTRIRAVVRTCVAEPQKKFRWGLQFESISALDKSLIAAFISQNDRREHPRISLP
jgi:c-di-GMP-binding flagellar brake protein YcgR